jgi:molecular chaperone GrpE
MMSKTDQSPSETKETKTPAETGETVVPADPTIQLEADVKTAKAESAEWQDRFLRKAAEFENFRKRADKEKSDLRIQSQSSILIEMLPVVDACERALKFFDKGQDIADTLQQYRDGVEMLYRQVLDAFSRAGAVPIESEGKPFDPHMHEALSREETSEFEEGVVARELRRGYMFRDKLLRPAQVMVAVPPQLKN